VDRNRRSWRCIALIDPSSVDRFGSVWFGLVWSLTDTKISFTNQSGPILETRTHRMATLAIALGRRGTTGSGQCAVGLARRWAKSRLLASGPCSCCSASTRLTASEASGPVISRYRQTELVIRRDFTGYRESANSVQQTLPSVLAFL
jgi:hypothetical protein